MVSLLALTERFKGGRFLSTKIKTMLEPYKRKSLKDKIAAQDKAVKTEAKAEVKVEVSKPKKK